MSSKPVTAVGAALIAIFCATTLVVAEQRGTPPPPPPPPAAPLQVLPPSPPPPPAAVVPLSSRTSEVTRLVKCAVVLSRFQAEKRVSSMPYELLATARETEHIGSAERTNLRVGIELPSVNGQASRFVGTRIDCAVALRQGTNYLIYLNLIDSAWSEQPGSLRTYSVSNVLPVREGQPLQFSVGTDQFTGETLRAEVTVTTVK